MATPRQLYAEYRVMPSLQLHQLRVAAVGKLVSENFKDPIRTRDVVLTCLFHDMGNIIKSELSYFPEFLKPQGLVYWQGVKDEYVKKYGADHHAANSAIARGMHLPESVCTLIDSLGFSKLEEVLKDPSLERKVCEYADLRVGPYGVLPLIERLLEGRRRYLETNKIRPHYESEDSFRRLSESARKLEEQVLSNTSLARNDISDAAIQNSIEELQNYSVA